MKYLKRFNKQLCKLRETKRLSQEDIAEICSVDASVVEAWESEVVEKRCYPTLENLLDICFKTGRSLDYFVDIHHGTDNEQLELPGLTHIEDNDLNSSLAELSKEMERLIPTEDEQELLRRYRRSDPQSKELILQLIAN